MIKHKLKKKKPYIAHFSIRNKEYTVMEDKQTGAVNLYLSNPNPGSLHLNIMHIGTFNSIELAEDFINNVHGIKAK